MTRSEIIEKLFTGKNFNDCIAKMEPDYLREDLRQEVILIVCEWSEEKIIKLNNDHALEFYVVKVILNQIKSNTSPFAKKYRQLYSNVDNDKFFCSDSFSESIDKEERQLKELVEDIAIKEIDRLYWYNKGLIELYIKHGNFRAIEKQTGIPFASCYKTIKKSFNEIKQKVAR